MKQRNKKGVTLDDLAGMVADGFQDTSKDIAEVKQDVEEIKLKLDNVAYRFELQELQRRVDLLEQRVGIGVHK